MDKETANVENVETVETVETEAATGGDNAGTGEVEKPAPDVETQRKIESLEQRNSDLEQKLETLVDSVAKLIESGVQIGGALPPRHNEPPKRSESEETLDHLFKE